MFLCSTHKHLVAQSANRIKPVRVTLLVRLLLLNLVFFSGLAFSATAPVIQLDPMPAKPLGKSVQYLIERNKPLTLAQAIESYRAGQFKQAQQVAINFGIASAPVWIRLELDNLTLSTFPVNLVTGATWYDYLDFYLVYSGQVQNHAHTGDETPEAKGLIAAVGYTFPMTLEPGSSTVYLRIDSIDPSAFILELLSQRQLQIRQLHYGYFYGFFYGFLAALCIYNLLLYAGLRERSYLYYSLMLIVIITCNLGYTGHGLQWLWPKLVSVQRYIVLVMMVLISVFSLLFASRFLNLSEHAPRMLKAVRFFIAVVLTAMSLAVLVESHLFADLIAFATIIMFTIVILTIGIIVVHQGVIAGRYFLAATLFGLLGVATTDLAVWGKIPFSFFTYHAFEFGISIEASLLAMALAYRIRCYQEANLQAEQIARQDPLTGLHNRRAFLELAQPYWSSANRGGHPLSLIMMDIDHFKQINDRYGHSAGDSVLNEVSLILSQNSRGSDIIARWGGEEFILLLTDTDLNSAAAYAERLRQAITTVYVPTKQDMVKVTASFGVAEYSENMELKTLIDTADQRLYQAKEQGRNQVCVTDEAEFKLAVN